jgi:hypothetical protein
MNTASLLARLQGLLASGTRVASVVRARLERLPGFGFDETMAGTLTLAGETRPRRIVFSLHAEAPRGLDYLLDGQTRVGGVISIEDLTEAAPLTGSLFIWPLRRVIRYELSFAGADGEPLRFVGQKDVRLTALRRTMTVLPGRLLGPGESGGDHELGRGELRFDLADLPSFLNSFRSLAVR